MCLAVYVATDAPLPVGQWDEHAPTFYLEAVPASESVCKQFRYPRVYYAGSHEGCGCGFFKDGKEGPELEQSQDSYRALAAALSSALQSGAKVQLFTCWEGEQTAAPESVANVTLEQLIAPDFELQQLSLLDVLPGASGHAVPNSDEQ